MKADVPLDVQCKDKFLLQSTSISEEDAALPLHDLVTSNKIFKKRKEDSF